MFILILFLPSTHKPLIWTTVAEACGLRVPKATANLFALERSDKNRLLLMQIAYFFLLVDSSFKNSVLFIVLQNIASLRRMACFK